MSRPRREGEPSDERLVHSAEDFRQGARDLAHAALGMALDGIPAPVIYAAMWDLSSGLHGLRESLGLISAGLMRSLETYDVTDDKNDPLGTVHEFAVLTDTAREHLAEAAMALEAAHTAINSQGHNGRKETG